MRELDETVATERCGRAVARPRAARVGIVGGLSLLLVAGACEGPPVAPGVPQYQELGLVEVPGGVVNVLTASFGTSRSDLTLETRLGPQSVGATYSSASRSWLWSFDIRYADGVFETPTGARLKTSGVAPGRALPGTIWVVVSGTALKTKGGLLHEFSPQTGRLLRVRWAHASYPRIEFVQGTVAGEPRTIRVEQQLDASNSTELYGIEYTQGGRPWRVVDRAGRRAEFLHDTDGRLVVARDGHDVETGRPGTRYEYASPTGRLLAITTTDGERVEIAYCGPRVEEVRARGEVDPVHGFEHGALQAGVYRSTYRDALGHEWVYEFDEERRLLARTDPLGNRTAWEWSGLRPVRRTTPSGEVTEWTWQDDDVVAERMPSGNTRRSAYRADAIDRQDPKARPVLRISDDLGPVEERRYDAAGRLVEHENGEGEIVTFEWDEEELLVSTTTAGGIVAELREYGDHGLPGVRSVAREEQLFAYDDVGNRIEGGDWILAAAPGGGGIRSVSYDADRNAQRIELIDQAAWLAPGTPAWIEIDYRGDRRPLEIRRPYGADTIFEYDALGRLVTRVERASGVGHAPWQSTHFRYDAMGRTTSVERPNGMREEWIYDAAGRLATHRILRDGVEESVEHFTYDADRLVARIDSVHGVAEHYGYDGAGRIGVVHYPDGEQLWRSYDLRSRVLGEHFVMEDARVLRHVEHAYDLADREVELRDEDGLLFERVFRDGREAETRYGNGLERIRSFEEDLGRLERTELRSPAGELVASARYDWLNSWCLAPTCVTTLTNTVGSLTWRSREAYELGSVHEADQAAGRRLSASSAGTGDSHVGWRFDHLSNLMGTERHCSGRPDVTQVVYNPEHNRVLRTEGPLDCGVSYHEYAYDAAGFVVERDGLPIAWDGAGRVRQIGFGAELVWDTSGRLVSRTVDGARQRMRFGGAVEGDAGGAPRALEAAEVRIDLASGARLYRHRDIRGNVKLATDDSGDVVAHYRYGPYGLLEAVATTEDLRGFAEGTRLGGLVLLGHRPLDADAAGFLAPDPVYQLVNQYAYTLGNPVLYWDPLGRHASGADSNGGQGSGASTAWGVAFYVGLTGGALIGATAGPLGALLGGLIGLATVNHAYQLATDEQGIGSQQAIEIFKPTIDPGCKCSGKYVPAKIRPLPDVFGDGRAVRRWRGRPAPPRQPMGLGGISGPDLSGSAACGLGFEAGIALGMLALAGRLRRRESPHAREERAR